MTKLAFVIAFGAIGGATLVTMATTPVGPVVADRFSSGLASVSSLMDSRPAARPANPVEAADNPGQGVFLSCLRKAGPDTEHSLRDILAYHDHAATLSLVECLLDVEPQRYCPPEGAAKAADVMEIYLWARDDAKLSSPAHGLADRIRLASRVTDAGEPAPPDPFALSWSSPRDQALFEKLRALARQGFLEPGAFGYSGRAELREALAGVKPQGAPCVGMARAD